MATKKPKSANKAIKTADKNVETESYIGKPRKHSRVAIKMVNHIAKTSSLAPMDKTASCYPSSTGLGMGTGRGMSDINTSFASFYDPYFEPSTLVLPRNLLEINAWCRYFYKYDAYVSTAIDMHAELPLSKMRLQPPKCNSKRRSQLILQHFEKMIGTEGIDLYEKLLQIGVEYNKLGNVFPYLQLNEEGTAWEKLTLLDPDYIVIEKLQFTNVMHVELIPNDRLREIVAKGDHDEHTGELAQTLAPNIKEDISMGRNIRLSTETTSSHVSHIARKMSDYDIYGTSLIERNFKALVYKDRLRRSQDAIATRHLTPKHLISTESTANDVDIEILREQVEMAMTDPDYALITNFEVTWQLIGTSQGLMQLSSEWEWINDELMVGLMLNKSFVLGEGAFANGQTVLEILEQRYGIYRSAIEDWVEHHIFKPISKLNNFTETRLGYVRNDKGEIEEQQVECLIYPKIKWNRLNLTDDNQHKQMLAQMVERGFLDVDSWLEYFGLDGEIIVEKLKKYKDTPLDANYQDMQKTIQSEVGRIIAPAIAKVKADDLGLKIADNPDQMATSVDGMFKTSDDDSIPISNKKVASINDLPITSQNLYHTLVGELTSKIMNRMAETREQRKLDRKVKKLHHRKKQVINKFEPEEKPKIYPPREDLKKDKKIELFSNIDDEDIVQKKNFNHPDLSETHNSLYCPIEQEL